VRGADAAGQAAVGAHGQALCLRFGESIPSIMERPTGSSQGHNRRGPTEQALNQD
jgi:hypothetical protein